MLAENAGTSIYRLLSHPHPENFICTCIYMDKVHSYAWKSVKPQFSPSSFSFSLMNWFAIHIVYTPIGSITDHVC